jgi:HAD superfamily hydrolase (TIGR01450 family)
VGANPYELAQVLYQRGVWVVCTDEKTSIQARAGIDAPQPATAGHAQHIAARYERHGALQLFAGLSVADGQVFGCCRERRCFVDFQAFILEVLADEDVVVVAASMDRAVTYEKLKRATLLIRGGARFLATNRDPTYPSEEGLLPGTGTMIAALETASGVKPTVIGKPEPAMFQLAMAQMGARPETTATIGDRLETDILGGQRAGLTTICVLSGASSRAEAETFGPDYIFEDIADLLHTWQAS